MPPIPLPDPLLDDGRVRLRALEEADVSWVARESRDPQVARFTTVPPDNSEADVRDFLAAQPGWRAAGEQVHLLVVEAGTGQRVGVIGLHHLDWHHRTAEVGYWTARDARRRGLTTAAVRLLTDWAFTSLDIERVELRPEPENIGSRALAERLGFRCEGTLRAALRLPEGRRDVLVYGVLPEELTRR